MKSLKHKLLIFVAIAGLAFAFLAPHPASAKSSDSTKTTDSSKTTATSAAACPGQDTLTVENNLAPDQHTCCPKGSQKAGAKKDNATSCIFAKYINPLIVLLSAIVGVMVVIGIIVGSIQYSSAGGDPSKTAAAKKRIANSIFALVAYFFLFTILQWLTPGGL